mgnify:CR=1 FL=1
MLNYHEENRPSIDQILDNSYMNFHVDTELNAYLKPKTNILPEPFIKKYLVYRSSKTLHKYDPYYQEASFMALSTEHKKLVRIYTPEVKMFEA